MATVDEICEKAGVGKGSFYHVFPSKEEFSLVLLQWYHQGEGKELLPGRSIILARINKDRKVVSRGFQHFKSYLQALSG